MKLKNLIPHHQRNHLIRQFGGASLVRLSNGQHELIGAQIDAQSLGAGGLLPSLLVTLDKISKSEKTHVNMGLKSLNGTVTHEGAEKGKWSERQDLNLRHLGPKPSALPG